MDRKRALSESSDDESDDGAFDPSQYDMTEDKVAPLEEDELDEQPKKVVVTGPKVLSGRECPYMDTIDRNVLDFDAARECSVTGAVQNIYSCLVCGKFFQGRGPHTQAYLHAVSASHHVFINLTTEKVWVFFFALAYYLCSDLAFRFTACLTATRLKTARWRTSGKCWIRNFLPQRSPASIPR